MKEGQGNMGSVAGFWVLFSRLKKYHGLLKLSLCLVISRKTREGRSEPESPGKRVEVIFFATLETQKTQLVSERPIITNWHYLVKYVYWRNGGKIMENTNLVAHCGLFCQSCSVYIASQFDEAALELIAAKLNTTKEEMYCNGCRLERIRVADF
jgi:hypothetical protein